MGKKKGAQTTSTYAPDPQAKAAYLDVINRAKDTVQSNPYQAYQGDLVAGFTPDQQSAFQNINATQGSVQPYLNTATGLALQSAQGINPMQFSGQQIQQYMNPYIQNVVDTTQANINQNNAIQQNQLRGNAIAKGAFGGDRAGIAQAELARNQNLASQQTIAGLYGQGYQQAADMFKNQQMLDYQKQLANAGLLQSAGQQIAGYGTTGQEAALQSANAQLAAGTMQQALRQQELDKAYEQWQLQKQFPYQQTSWLANIINGTAGGLGGTTTQTQPAPSSGSQYLGLATAALGLFSDERVKENAEPVGKMFDGTPIYKYEYKGDPTKTTHMGVMAQDIEKKYPEAVHHTPEGVKMVEYDAATREAADRGKFAGGGLAGVSPYGIFTDAMLQPITQARAQMPQVSGGAPQTGADQKQIDAFAENLGDASDNIKKRFFPAQSTKGVAPTPTARPDINTIAPPSPVQQSPLAPIPETVPLPAPESPIPPLEANNLGFGSMFGFGAKSGGRINYAGGGLAEGLDPRDLAIRTILGEAGNQGDEGQAAVAHVLRNRLNSGAYGDKLEDVILAPKQFSVWNSGDRAGDYARGVNPNSEQYRKAGDIFDAVQRGEIEDPTKGATHYANVNTVLQQRGGNLQPWLANMLNQPDTIQIGAHTFGKADAGRGVTSEGIQNALRAGADRERGVAPVQVADSSGQIGYGGVAPTFDSGVTPSGVRTNLPIQNKASKSGILGALGIETTPEFNEALIAAGLGMMAGTSPYAGVNIGQGGLQGVQYYKDAIARQRDLAKAGSEIAAQSGKLQLEQLQNPADIALKQAQAARERAATMETGFIPGVGLSVFDKSAPEKGFQVYKPNVVGGEQPSKPSQGKVAPTPAVPTQEPISGNPIDDRKKPLNDILGWQPKRTISMAEVPDAEERQFRVFKAPDKGAGEQALGLEAVKIARAESKNAIQQQMRLDQMKHEYDALPSKGLINPGTNISERMNLAKGINTFIGSFGGKPVFDTKDVSALEALSKDSFRLGAELSRSIGGNEPGFIVQSAIEANPSAANTKQGWARIVAGLDEAAQYKRDYGEFLDNYYNTFGHTNGAQETFAKFNPASKYVERAIVSTVDPMDLQHLIENKGTPLASKIKAAIDKKYGEGTAKIILGAK